MRLRLALMALGWVACGGDSEVNRDEDPLPITDCAQALINLQDWSDGLDLDLARTDVLVAVCDNGTSMATNGRLHCLLESDVDAAANCVSRAEREGLMDTCDSETDPDMRADCESLLGEPSTLVVEARRRAIQSGDWLELWKCHGLDEQESNPSIDEVQACGLLRLEHIFLADCLATQFSSDVCDARWALQEPRAVDWIANQIVGSQDSQNPD